MIKPYYGEFLIIPMPLELSLERCSNNCHYCFSNLNGYRMKDSLKSILNHLSKFNSRKDQGSFLLRNKYSLCFSNRSDPFCDANYKTAYSLCEIFTELGIDVAYQTKGGKGLFDILGFIKPSIWYVTICQDDDWIRQKIEPGTKSINDRLTMIQELTDHGQLVNVGINPFVPEWIKNKKRLVQDIKRAGAYGITVEGLHFSHEQVRRLKEGVIDPKIVARALKKNAGPFEMEQYHELCDIILSEGLELWSFWNNHVSHLWRPYYERYKCFPIMTNFTNWVFENKKDGDTITFDEFYKVMGGMPKVDFKIDSYVMSINRSFKDKNIPVFGSDRNLLKIFWSQPKLKTCPANHPNLSIIAKLIDKKTVELTGKLPVYMYRKRPFTSIFVTDQGEAI